MDLMEVINLRHSVRKYQEKPVEEEKIARVLEAARLAPSWRNLQCWKFIIVKDSELKKKLIQCTSPYNQSWLGKEPLIIVACGAPQKSGFRNNQYYYLVDVAIALEHLILAATELGLGTCWIGAYDEEKIKKLLHIPDHIRIVAITPLGYPATEEGFVGRVAQKVIKSKTRKSIAEISCVDTWT